MITYEEKWAAAVKFCFVMILVIMLSAGIRGELKSIVSCKCAAPCCKTVEK